MDAPEWPSISNYINKPNGGGEVFTEQTTAGDNCNAAVQALQAMEAMEGRGGKGDGGQL